MLYTFLEYIVISLFELFYTKLPKGTRFIHPRKLYYINRPCGAQKTHIVYHIYIYVRMLVCACSVSVSVWPAGAQLKIRIIYIVCVCPTCTMDLYYYTIHIGLNRLRKSFVIFNILYSILHIVIVIVLCSLPLDSGIVTKCFSNNIIVLYI